MMKKPVLNRCALCLSAAALLAAGCVSHGAGLPEEAVRYYKMLQGFWELPYLIPLGDKHVLMVGAPGNPYWIGNFDVKTLRFTPDAPDPQFIDRGNYYSTIVGHMGP